ncbi:MAG: hypothetical protein H6705_06780 [Myxococcales bacterium]|nr:hypothetical protein [Myxococcales bacterium]
MRAFVAGATGLTGRHVVEGLGAVGGEAVAHVRPDSGRLEAWRARFGEMGAEVDCSAWSREGMEGAMRRWRPDVFGVAVINGLSGARGMRLRGGGFWAVALLIDAVARRGGGARWCIWG